MKNIVMLIGVMVLVVSLLLPACTLGGAPKGDLPASISYGTLPMGTTFHTTGIAHADVIKNHTGMEVFIEPVSNPVAILIQLLQAKELDAAITMGFHTWYSFSGKPGSAPNIRDLRTLFRWTQFRYGYIARADAGIKTMKDLKGKKVSALWPANAAFQDLVNETLLG
ncbi:MAG: TAXI family TRAP transporter solute-binding subunit, partial [Dehalococcoidia bacterium]|nr:TAXI family TRAP transporter solute-binding subunit [Dehalococcoidia bacterium]